MGDLCYCNEHVTPMEVEVIEKWENSKGEMRYLSDHNAVISTLIMYER